MTREEKIAELINIRDNFNYTLAPREVFDDAIKTLNQTTPCDLCRYNPPSIGDGKPCSMCPACGGEEA